MIYLIAAYVVVWLLTFVFVVTVFWRQRQLQQQLAWMEQLLEKEAQAHGPNEATTSA